MMSQTVVGPFITRKLGCDVWRLTTGSAAGPEILLRGLGQPGPELLNGSSIAAVDVEWRPNGVMVNLTIDATVRQLRADSAIIHVPDAHLYGVLPLLGFDSDAKRFWKRVFRLIRLPGGRYLLRFLARGRAGREKSGTKT